MASAIAAAALGFSPALPVRAPARQPSVQMAETYDDMQGLAKKLNPVVGYWDPLKLVEPTDPGANSFFGQYGDAGAIAFLRHAEIKHGRVAMAGFVGFCVQANGIHFPWALTGGAFGGPTTMFADISAAGGPPAQWDALPTAAKVQILLAVGFLELWGEGAVGADHYMKGGKPGYYPSFAELKGQIGHPVLDLWDPFGFTKKMSAEKKEKSLLAEINNGRLAMIGTMSMVAASSVEGSVPALAGKIPHYDGEVMAPFSAVDAGNLPFVSEMLAFPHMDSVTKFGLSSF